jgi:hypothetical protein
MYKIVKNENVILAFSYLQCFLIHGQKSWVEANDRIRFRFEIAISKENLNLIRRILKLKN